MITLDRISVANAMTFKEVRLRALLDSPSAFGSTYAKESLLSGADWANRAAQFSGAQSIGYLALDDGVACGIAAGFLQEDDTARAHLISMWVGPSHRRHGVGQLLVEAIIGWARSLDVRALHLMVTCNNTAAIGFYQRLGFIDTGRTEPYPNDPALFEHEMSRRIF